MEENVTVNVVENKEEVSTQEKEAAVLQEAVDKGEVDSNYGFQEDGVYRINVDKPPTKEKENAVQEQETTSVSVGDEAGDSKKVDEEIRVEDKEEPEEKITPLEEIVEEPVIEEEQPIEEKIVEETVEKQPQPQKDIKIEYPENIQKLVDFMQETGGRRRSWRSA